MKDTRQILDCARPDIKRGRVLSLVLQRTKQQRATDRKITAWAIVVCAALALACVIAAQVVGGRV